MITFSKFAETELDRPLNREVVVPTNVPWKAAKPKAEGKSTSHPIRLVSEKERAVTLARVALPSFTLRGVTVPLPRLRDKGSQRMGNAGNERDVKTINCKKGKWILTTGELHPEAVG